MLRLLEKCLVYFNSVSLTQFVLRHECEADAKHHDAQKIKPQLPTAFISNVLSNWIFGFSLILTFIVGAMQEAIRSALFEVDKLYFFLCVERQDRWCRSNGDKVTRSVSVLFFLSSPSLFSVLCPDLYWTASNLFRINEFDFKRFFPGEKLNKIL